MRTNLLAIASSIFIVSAAYADEKHRELGTHVHGHGTFNIAIEGNAVTMELEAPGADIVGFENAAETAEQKKALKAAEDELRKPLALFVFPSAAHCSVKNARVMVEGGHIAENHDHEKKSDEHKHEAESEMGHESHFEFHAEYELACKAPEALTGIEFKYFERFKGAQELEVKVITAKGQRQYEVERDAPRITLGGLM